MCKIGVISIGLDLSHSAFLHLRTVTTSLREERDVGIVSLLDLLAHALALVTLVQTFRGRANRQFAGRVTFPVLLVKFANELRSGFGVTGSFLSYLRGVLTLLKGLVFLLITSMLAFGNDRSYIGKDEWFPDQGPRARGRKGHHC